MPSSKDCAAGSAVDHAFGTLRVAASLDADPLESLLDIA